MDVAVVLRQLLLPPTVDILTGSTRSAGFEECIPRQLP